MKGLGWYLHIESPGWAFMIYCCPLEMALPASSEALPRKLTVDGYSWSCILELVRVNTDEGPGVVPAHRGSQVGTCYLLLSPRDGPACIVKRLSPRSSRVDGFFWPFLGAADRTACGDVGTSCPWLSKGAPCILVMLCGPWESTSFSASDACFCCS